MSTANEVSLLMDNNLLVQATEGEADVQVGNDLLKPQNMLVADLQRGFIFGFEPHVISDISSGSFSFPECLYVDVMDWSACGNVGTMVAM